MELATGIIALLNDNSNTLTSDSSVLDVSSATCEATATSTATGTSICNTVECMYVKDVIFGCDTAFSTTATGAECSQACENDPTCTHFTWTGTTHSNKCHFKAAVPESGQPCSADLFVGYVTSVAESWVAGEAGCVVTPGHPDNI